jgi:hypothetical protein
MNNDFHADLLAARANHFVAQHSLSLTYLVDMSRLLRSVRLVLHLVRRMNQRFFNCAENQISE